MRSTAIDRRLTMRVLQIWRRLARGPMLPRRSQVDPRLFGADWPNCLLLDVDPVPEHSRIAYVGDKLRDSSWPPFERQCLAECVSGTLLHLTTSKLSIVLENAAPVSFGGSALHGETSILYRAILLPLAEHGMHIDGIIGAVSYREVSLANGVESLPLDAAVPGFVADDA
ncbi:MAG: hypothetical protein ACREFQ_03280 [Stellaceae bacterium]